MPSHPIPSPSASQPAREPPFLRTRLHPGWRPNLTANHHLPIFCLTRVSRQALRARLRENHPPAFLLCVFARGRYRLPSPRLMVPRPARPPEGSRNTSERVARLCMIRCGSHRQEGHGSRGAIRRDQGSCVKVNAGLLSCGRCRRLRGASELATQGHSAGKRDMGNLSAALFSGRTAALDAVPQPFVFHCQTAA